MELRYIKLFENFDRMNYYDIRDIFLSISDLGMKFHDVNVSTDVKDGKVITLMIDREPHKNSEFNFNDEFYDELRSAISHFESDYDSVLYNIYIRGGDNAWVDDVDELKKHIDSLSEYSLTWLSLIDITFTKL